MVGVSEVPLAQGMVIDAILKLSSLQRVSLEGSRVSMQGASYLRHSAPKLTVDLVFPFVWGERWSYFPALAPGNALAKAAGSSENNAAKPQAG